MLVPLSWLKDYVDINISADELEKKLFDCGFEVEENGRLARISAASSLVMLTPVSRFRKHIFMCARSM